MLEFEEVARALRGKRCNRRTREDAAQALRQLLDEKTVLENQLRQQGDTIARLQSEVKRLAQRADEGERKVADAIRVLSAPPSLAAPDTYMQGQPARLHGLGLTRG